MFKNLNAFWEYLEAPITDQDLDKTSATPRICTYSYTSTPFGLQNTPATFQCALDIILSVVQWKICFGKIDEGVIFFQINVNTPKTLI